MTKQQAIDLVATKLMGWHRDREPNGTREDMTECVWRGAAGLYEANHNWSPFVDANALRVVREKLGAQFAIVELIYSRSLKEWQCRLLTTRTEMVSEVGPTEAHAVMAVALKVIGNTEEIEP